MNGLHFIKRNTSNYIFCLLSAFFITTSIPDVFSQRKFREGHIINLEGDTISGLISYKRNKLTPEKIYFKDQALYKSIEYTPAELKGFFIQDEQFISAEVEKNIVPASADHLPDRQSVQPNVETGFLQILVLGEKNLFRMKDNNGRIHYIIQKGNHYQMLQPGKNASVRNGHSEENAKQQLREYLQDCHSITVLIGQTRLQYKSLLKLFDAYYRCVKTRISHVQVP